MCVGLGGRGTVDIVTGSIFNLLLFYLSTTEKIKDKLDPK